MNSFRFVTVVLFLYLQAMAVPLHAGVWKLHSYAHIQDDGSLLIDGERVHLYGIYIPDSGRRCQTNVRPSRCGSRAVLALEFKIRGRGFLHCFPQSENNDGTLNGICYIDRTRFDDGEDLGAYLIKKGWAMALPDAPFEYHALERIARSRSQGVWGFPADRIR